MVGSSDVPMSTSGIKSRDATARIGEKKYQEEVGTTLKDAPAYTPRRLRVVTIGAGYSGLTLAHKFQHQHPELQGIIDHTIYESRNELGGTWLVNTYPGVVCDVPSHIYVSDSPPTYL
jgi:ribulose 1,5-bisphosphate synthetase/thiazole synthase